MNVLPAFRVALLLLGLLGASAEANAACASPVGGEGQMLYASNINQMVFCNGTDWITMGGSNDGGGGASALSGLSDVNTSGASIGSILSYNGSSWVVSSSAAAGVAALASLTDVSASAPLNNQILRYNASQTKWEAVSASEAIFSCPSGYALVSAGGRAYGCIKTTENSSGTCSSHINSCMAEGARLPTLSEFKMAQAQYGYTVANYAYLENAAGDNDCAGITSGGRPYGIGDTGNYPARCFIPAVGIISSTSGGSALGDRITSGTVSVTTNPNGYVSLTTGGTDWGYLSSGNSYLPKLNTMSVSGTYFQLTSPSVSISCNSAISGSLRNSSGTIQVCNGTSWGSLAGVAALASLTDVQVTNLAGRDYLRYDALSSKWVNISESTVMSTTSVVPGWPDRIYCSGSDGDAVFDYYNRYTNEVRYRLAGSEGNYAVMTYNFGTGAQTAHTTTGGFANYMTSCSGKTIAQLYSGGQAFDFVGGSNGGSTALGDRITSGTLSVVANSATSIVSLSTNGTTWGYFANGGTYLPNLLTIGGNISATGGVSVTGNIQAQEYLHHSDRRLKDDIKEIPNAAELLTKLRGTHFKWKSNGQFSYGLIAQEVEEVLPELVPSGEGMKSVAYDQMIPILIEGWKIHQKSIESLSAANDHERERLDVLTQTNDGLRRWNLSLREELQAAVAANDNLQRAVEELRREVLDLKQAVSK